MKLKKVITISSFLLLLSTPIKAQAVDIMPSVGITEMVQDITEDKAKWAYAKELGEQKQSEELRLLSALIWCEAGNQCEAGQQAVGIVVMNRVEDEDFEDTIETVIYESGQFRPKTDGRLKKALKMYDDGDLPQECIDAAWYAMNGNSIVVYEGQRIDMTEYLYFATHWKNARLTIQDHDFK